MRKQRHDLADAGACPMEIALDYVGGKWKGVILFRLAGGPVRFAALQRLLCRITARTLTQQLREMEQDGLVIRTVYAEVPPRVDYALTPAGRALIPALTLLKEWSETQVLGRPGRLGGSPPRTEVTPALPLQRAAAADQGAART
jgi:DNA-binding HxlR family transcriptional regulator